MHSHNYFCFEVTVKLSLLLLLISGHFWKQSVSQNSNIIIIQRLHAWAIMQTLSYCQSVKTFPKIPETLELVKPVLSSLECHHARGPPPAQTHSKSPPQVIFSCSCPAKCCSPVNTSNHWVQAYISAALQTLYALLAKVNLVTHMLQKVWNLLKAGLLSWRKSAQFLWPSLRGSRGWHPLSIMTGSSGYGM